ncbi:lasso peptide biosynthesis B2 protein [Phenylobacterium terrae]|uniref:Lasso peptide biosynthesis B2 protein n=1 Tax=Phenylobacterium terrae TaxID=2665495 RepID=A0ABW4N6L6_9CAUL
MSAPATDRREAWIGDDLVILDLAADRYDCAQAARRSAARPHASADAAAAGAPADLEALPPGPDVLRPVEGLALILSLLDLVRLYPGRGLAGVLGAVERRRRAGPADPEAVLRIARAFRRLAIWLPISRKCLVRSFVLARLLQRCGHGCAWVVGVRTWPFAAHCWLQHGRVVLDDRPERLAPYAVIHQVSA